MLVPQVGGVVDHCPSPAVSHGTMAVFYLVSQGCGRWGPSAFLGLGLKHDGALDAISSLTKTVSVVSGPDALFLRLFDADQASLS